MEIEEDKNRDKVLRIDKELIKKERRYVDIMNLIEKKFKFRVEKEKSENKMLKKEMIKKMFYKIK